MNLTMRQLAPLFGASKSAADRIIDHLGPLLALQPRRQFRKDTVLIVEGTLVPTRDFTIAGQSKNYRYSTAHQVVIDADTHLVVVVGWPLPGNRNDSRGLGGIWRKRRCRRHDDDRRRRLPRYRPGHPAPPPERPRTPGLEGGAPGTFTLSPFSYIPFTFEESADPAGDSDHRRKVFRCARIPTNPPRREGSTGEY